MTKHVHARQQPDCVGGDGLKIGIAHLERMNARQVRERLVADRRLVTTTHVERMDARQVRERLVADRRLIDVEKTTTAYLCMRIQKRRR